MTYKRNRSGYYDGKVNMVPFYRKLMNDPMNKELLATIRKINLTQSKPIRRRLKFGEED